MKLIIGTLLALTVILGFGVYKAKADEVMRTQAVNPVYKIMTTGPEGPEVCSATSILVDKIPEELKNANIFLTAKHCVNPEHPIGKLLDETVTEYSETTNFYDYKVVAVSPSSDLALIIMTTSGPKIPGARIADTQKAQEGDEVFSVGYPLGGSRTVTVGLLGQKERSVQPMGDLKVMQRASTQIDKGMSGGPLYQKTSTGYEIIGVASTKAGGNNFMNSFVTLTDIKNFIEKGE
jgi:serine protease Do